jgi:hypothetical protein
VNFKQKNRKKVNRAVFINIICCENTFFLNIIYFIIKNEFPT